MPCAIVVRDKWYSSYVAWIIIRQSTFLSPHDNRQNIDDLRSCQHIFSTATKLQHKIFPLGQRAVSFVGLIILHWQHMQGENRWGWHDELPIAPRKMPVEFANQPQYVVLELSNSLLPKWHSSFLPLVCSHCSYHCLAPWCKNRHMNTTNLYPFTWSQHSFCRKQKNTDWNRSIWPDWGKLRVPKFQS